MTEIDTARAAAATERGSSPSFVESFRIEGLYGYRTISLASQYAATVLIAKNGAGKTTLLAALDAFLKGQFSRLRDVKFLRICCKLRGFDEELVLTREDLLTFVNVKAGAPIYVEAQRLQIDPIALFNFVVDEYTNDEFIRIPPDHDVLGPILRRFEYRRSDARAFCDSLRDALSQQTPALQKIFATLKIAFKDTEIVYLPTYRRIELPFTGPESVDRYGRRKRPFRFAQTGLHAGDIQFGLSDISERLNDLNQSILVESNQGYRQISAAIINELIDGSFDRGTTSAGDIPNKDELELFFSRLKEGRNARPFYDVSIPNIDRVYSSVGISDGTNKFLRYFLSKLNTVISSTRTIEADVRDFIKSCNSYLSTQDESTLLPSGQRTSEGGSGDDKALILNRKDLQVHVESLADGRKITLDALSSGEKQMISLFAKLFLYSKDKILLIDEPELSLSIDWQRQILIDAISAPRCKQIIAITHSPFVFDNALEPFARSLVSSIDPRDGVSPPEEIEGDSV